MKDEKRKKQIAEFLKTDRLKLINYVRRLIDDTAERDSEDIIQDVMLNIFNMSDVTIPIDNIASYIYRSIRNRIIDIHKKRKYESVSFDEFSYNMDISSEFQSDYRNNAADEFDKNEIRDKMFSAIDSLNDEYKEIIIMTEFEGKSFKEISDESNIPIGTLLSRKSRAIRIIKERLNHLISDIQEAI